MNDTEYQAFDTVGLAELVARREVSPGELLDTAMLRLSQVNPSLNAVVLDLETQAREAISQGLPAGPLRGVPFLLKDITTQMAGVVTSAGSRVFAETVSAEDSALTAAYKRVGLVIFGKTNTPEFALTAITEPELFGTTLNPWNPRLTCGGSSGGAASAVAAGIAPAAQASDGGGSIRIPASCCGLFGLKPSRGRVSMAPQGEGWGGLTCLHALTRSVRDSAVLLDASCVPQPGDPYWLAPPNTPFAEDARRAPRPLRIGLLSTNLLGGPLAPPCAEAVRQTAKLCEALGHNVHEVAAPAGMDELVGLGAAVVCTALARNLETEAEHRGWEIGSDEIEPLTRLLYERGKSISAVQYAQAVARLHVISRDIAAWLAGCDVLMLSTLGRLPLPIGALKGDLGDLTDIIAKFQDFSPNTQLFNVTGQPAMSVPLAWDEDRFPIGVQFVGAMGGEATLFRLAGQLEAAQPWAHRRPPQAAYISEG